MTRVLARTAGRGRPHGEALPRAGTARRPAGMLPGLAHAGVGDTSSATSRRGRSGAAQLMETHLTCLLLAFYRSQHVNQNWLAALTAIVDVAALIKAAVPDENGDAADITFRIGRHALADLALQFRLEPVSADRLAETDFDDLFAIIDRSKIANVDGEVA